MEGEQWHVFLTRNVGEQRVEPADLGLGVGPAVVPREHVGEKDREVELWLPPRGLEELDQFGEKFGVPNMFAEAFHTREYADGETFETCGLHVTPVRVPHYQLQTFALRVSDGTSTLAYSGDSAPSPQLAEVGRDADLFLCEATLRESVEGGNGLRGHLSAEEAVAAFKESRARRLVIIHRPDELPLDRGIERAADGDVFTF